MIACDLPRETSTVDASDDSERVMPHHSTSMYIDVFQDTKTYTEMRFERTCSKGSKYRAAEAIKMHRSPVIQRRSVIT